MSLVKTDLISLGFTFQSFPVKQPTGRGGYLPTSGRGRPGMPLAFCVPWVPTSLLTAWRRRKRRKVPGETVPLGSPPRGWPLMMYIKFPKNAEKKIQDSRGTVRFRCPQGRGEFSG